MQDQHKNPQNINLTQSKSPSPQPQLQVNRLKKILDKHPQQRNSNDHHFILNFIKQNVTLNKLSESMPIQFVKNLFKAAALVKMKKDKVVQMRGQKIEDVGIVLTGQLAALRNQEQMASDNLIESMAIFNNQIIFQKLVEYAKQYRKELKRRQSSIAMLQNSTKSKIAHHHGQQKSYVSVQFAHPDPITPQSIHSYINHNQFLGFSDRSLGQNFTRTCVCLNENTYILFFTQSHVMNCLETALKDKIKKLTHILRGIGCFKLLQLDKLQLIIQSMALRKRKRGQQIYKQHQQAQNFYLLTEGEIKIMKQTNLFQQNPNALYGNRKKLVQESLTDNNRQVENKAQKLFLDKKVKKLMLPYANLTNMYNFRPMKKNIQIGIMTPFSIFGQQQYGQKKTRDTSAICSSMFVQYYEISINKLQQIISSKLMPIFKKQLRQSVRKKVLYRQSQYAASVNLQNKNNLDYFYLQGQKQKQSPRKFKITKMNKLINIKKQAPANLSFREEQPLPSATYTTFNFDKMNRLTKTDRKHKKYDYQSEDEGKYEQNPSQLKIINVSHTWKLVKQKVDMEIKASQKISPFKPTINLSKPLIASDYFYHVQKQSKRIDREHRKRIASLNRSHKFNRTNNQKNQKIDQKS